MCLLDVPLIVLTLWLTMKHFNTDLCFNEYSLWCFGVFFIFPINPVVDYSGFIVANHSSAHLITSACECLFGFLTRFLTCLGGARRTWSSSTVGLFKESWSSMEILQESTMLWERGVRHGTCRRTRNVFYFRNITADYQHMIMYLIIYLFIFI